jgi:hypothetical protein
MLLLVKTPQRCRLFVSHLLKRDGRHTQRVHPGVDSSADDTENINGEDYPSVIFQAEPLGRTSQTADESCCARSLPLLEQPLGKV